LCVFGGFDPKTLDNIILTPKGTSLRQTTSFEPLTIKIAPAVWAVRGRMEIKTEKKPETFCYMLHICVDPPLHAINTILVGFHHIPDVINHANFGVDRVIGV
jgi:hypothetical protein